MLVVTATCVDLVEMFFLCVCVCVCVGEGGGGGVPSS